MFSLLGYLLSEDPVQLGVQGLYVVLQQLHFIMAIGNDTEDFFLDFPQVLVVSGQFFLGTVRLVAKLLLTSQVTGHSKSVAAVPVAPAEGFVDKTSGSIRRMTSVALLSPNWPQPFLITYYHYFEHFAS